MSRPDYTLGSTIDFKFTTRSFTTGVPTTLAGTPVISILVGNNATPITAGITLSVDFASVTGLNNVRVVATTGNGYATDSNYTIYISTGTVGGVSVVGEVVGEFSIEAQSPLRPTVAARTLDVTAAGNAGIDWANIENPSTAQDLSATQILSADAVGVVVAVGAGAIDSASFVAGAINSTVAPNLDAAVSTRATPAQVNAEVLDVLNVDTFAEPTGVPAATTTLQAKISRLYQVLRNRIVVDSNTNKKSFYDDADAPLWEKDLTDAGGVYSESEGNAP